MNPTIRSATLFIGGVTTLVFPAITLLLAAAVALFRSRRNVRLPYVMLLGASLLIVAGALPSSSLAWRTGIQAMGCVLVYWAASNLHLPPAERGRKPIVLGMTTALVSMLGLTVLQVVGDPGSRPTGWLYEPNVWAASTLMPLALIITLQLNPRLTSDVALLAVTILIWLSGSRTALFALLPFITIRLVGAFRERANRRGALITVAVLAALLGAVLHFSPGLRNATGARISGLWTALEELFLLDPALEPLSRNVLSMTEALDSSAWNRTGVSLLATEPGTEPAEFVITKTGSEGFSRVHQRVYLEPGHTYTVSADFRSTSGSWPYGFASISVDQPDSMFSAGTSSAGPRIYTAVGVEITDIQETTLDEDWTRLTATFRLDTETSSSIWRLGVAPDLLRRPSSASVTVRALQLESGPVATTYQATTLADQNQRQAHQAALGRLTYWQSGWLGFLQSPIFGQVIPFRDFHANRTGLPVSAGSMPNHSHNLVLQTLYEGGLLACIGLALLVGGALRSVRHWSPTLIGALLSLLVLSTFDLTFWSETFSYPLFALLGLHAGKQLPNDAAGGDSTVSAV